MTLDDLLAREAIRDIVARYNSYSDAGKFDWLWELFVDDAVMEVGPADPSRGDRTTYVGIESVKQMFIGAKDRVHSRNATAGPTYLRHFTATHQIDLDPSDADLASGRCYFAVLIDEGLDHWGRYIDDYVRQGGTWKFQHRRAYVDGGVPRSWFASSTS